MQSEQRVFSVPGAVPQQTRDHLRQKLFRKDTNSKEERRLYPTIAMTTTSTSPSRTLDNEESNHERSETKLDSAIAARDTTKNSVVPQPPDSSIPKSNKEGPNDSSQRSMGRKEQQAQEQPPALRLTSQPGQPQTLKRKRTTESGPTTLPTQQQQTKNPTSKRVDCRDIASLWKRYDLSATDATASHEREEFNALRSQIWRPSKFVPYDGKKHGVL